MKKALILATALIPTKAHAGMVSFALNAGYDVDFIISSRSHEPIPGHLRKEAFDQEFYGEDGLVVFLHEDDDAPQNDDGTPEFWNYWIRQIGMLTHRVKYDIVVGSEPYCKVLADKVEAEWVPFDTKRELFNIKGTDVRNDLYWRWEDIMLSFRPHLKNVVTIFGQESVGKTTMAKYLGQVTDSTIWVPEFARQYLEAVGPELTPEKMANIIDGQYAYQTVALEDTSTYLQVQDTDLFSTIGYYRILGWEVPPRLIELAQLAKSDLYLLMPDDVPFEEDALRYGGTVRESSYEFWKDILIEFDLPFIEVPHGSLHIKQEACWQYIRQQLNDSIADIVNFVRD